MRVLDLNKDICTSNNKCKACSKTDLANKLYDYLKSDVILISDKNWGSNKSEITMMINSCPYNAITITSLKIIP